MHTCTVSLPCYDTVIGHTQCTTCVDTFCLSHRVRGLDPTQLSRMLVAMTPPPPPSPYLGSTTPNHCSCCLSPLYTCVHPTNHTHTHPYSRCAATGIEQLPEDDVFLLDDSPQPQLSQPGCYRGVCVALKLHHLAVAAVDTAPQLAELSGALTLDGLLGPAAATFKVLRELVQVRGPGCDSP
jgi:hypothetical protein